MRRGPPQAGSLRTSAPRKRSESAPRSQPQEAAPAAADGVRQISSRAVHTVCGSTTYCRCSLRNLSWERRKALLAEMATDDGLKSKAPPSSLLCRKVTQKFPSPVSPDASILPPADTHNKEQITAVWNDFLTIVVSMSEIASNHPGDQNCVSSHELISRDHDQLGAVLDDFLRYPISIVGRVEPACRQMIKMDEYIYDRAPDGTPRNRSRGYNSDEIFSSLPEQNLRVFANDRQDDRSAPRQRALKLATKIRRAVYLIMSYRDEHTHKSRNANLFLQPLGLLDQYGPTQLTRIIYDPVRFLPRRTKLTRSSGQSSEGAADGAAEGVTASSSSGDPHLTSWNKRLRVIYPKEDKLLWASGNRNAMVTPPVSPRVVHTSLLDWLATAVQLNSGDQSSALGSSRSGDSMYRFFMQGISNFFMVPLHHAEEGGFDRTFVRFGATQHSVPTPSCWSNGFAGCGTDDNGIDMHTCDATSFVAGRARKRIGFVLTEGMLCECRHHPSFDGRLWVLIQWSGIDRRRNFGDASRTVIRQWHLLTVSSNLFWTASKDPLSSRRIACWFDVCEGRCRVGTKHPSVYGLQVDRLLCVSHFPVQEFMEIPSLLENATSTSASASASASASTDAAPASTSSGPPSRYMTHTINEGLFGESRSFLGSMNGHAPQIRIDSRRTMSASNETLCWTTDGHSGRQQRLLMCARRVPIIDGLRFMWDGDQSHWIGSPFSRSSARSHPANKQESSYNCTCSDFAWFLTQVELEPAVRARPPHSLNTQQGKQGKPQPESDMEDDHFLRSSSSEEDESDVEWDNHTPYTPSEEGEEDEEDEKDE